MNEELQKQYVSQLNTMYQNAQAWRKDHPDTEALIAWNFPAKVMIISPIGEAIKRGFVRTNPAGLELLKALWPNWNDRTEPTVLMCRVVLEMKDEVKRMAK